MERLANVIYVVQDLSGDVWPEKYWKTWSYPVKVMNKLDELAIARVNHGLAQAALLNDRRLQ